jgi:vitamin B12 transporter
MENRMRYCVLLLLCSFSVPAAAQKAKQLDEAETEKPIVLIHDAPHDYIVVDGGILARPMSDKVDPVRYIMEVDQGTGKRVENIVRDIPGWQQFRRSDSRSANPTSQGLTSRGLGGNAASRSLIILDGIPQADPFGGWVNWTAFDALNLKGIRIIDGGGSGSDGAGALAGTLQISTTKSATRGSLAYGSRNSIDADASIGVDAGRDSSITLSGNYSRGDGFVPIIARQRGYVDRASGYESYGIGARFVAQSEEAGRVEASVRAFNDRRSRGVPFSDNRNSGVDASVRVLPEIAGMSSMLLVYGQLREYSSQFGSVSANRQSASPTLDQFDVPSTGWGARFETRPAIGDYYDNRELRLGLDWRRTSGKTRENSNFVGGIPTRAREAGGLTETIGGYAELSASVGEIDFAISGRLDKWSIRDGRRLEINIGGSVRSDDNFADRSDWQWTGRAAASWKLADPVKLKLAVYRGWRLPTLNELYRPFRVGADATAANDALRPETMHGGQIKFESNIDNAEVGLTFFYSRLGDAIANVTLGQGPGNFPGVGFVAAGGIYRQRQNLDSLVSKGIELDAAFDLSDSVKLHVGYALIDANVRASGVSAAFSRLTPAQVSRHSGRAGVKWSCGNVSALADLRYIGKQFEDDANSRILDDALTVDGRITYYLGDKFSIELRGENLFDTQVEASISGNDVIERANPRTIWLGINKRFD